MRKNDLKLILVGETGVGKSQLGNFILKKEVFVVGKNTNSISENISIIGDKRVTIVDTPGLNDTNSRDYDIMEQIIAKFQNDRAIDGIILVYSFNKARKTQKDQELITNLKKIFGEDILKTRLKVIITNSSTGEEFDNEKNKIKKQKNDIIKGLDKMISKEDIVFVNTLNTSPHMKVFYPEIEKFLEQFYKVKMSLGSMNNELIKKQELEFNQRQKEELEAERKKEEKEDKRWLEKEKKELEEKNKSLLIQNENERKRSFIFEIFIILLLIFFFYFYENERKRVEKDHEKFYNKFENERERLEKKFEKLYEKFEKERRDYQSKEDKRNEERIKEERIKEEKIKEERIKEERIKEERIKQEKIKEERIKQEKIKEEKRIILKKEIDNLDTEIFNSELKINSIKREIKSDELCIAASGTFTVFTLGFSGFGIAHCMESEKAHKRELKIEEDRLEDLKAQRKQKENQLNELK